MLTDTFLPKETLITFKVKATSNCKEIATAIIKYHEEGKTIEIAALGANSVNQAIKAIAIARNEIASQGKDIVIKPRFETIYKNGEKLSALFLSLQIIEGALSVFLAINTCPW